jgi:putative oxidoreductase
MNNSILSTRSLNTDVASLLIRLIFGGIFVYHGFGKYVAYDHILPMFGDIIGIGSKLSFNLVIFAELICGLLVLVGFLTRLSVIPILITMIVAFFIAHAKDPFQVKELAFMYMLLSIVVFVLGSGKYSVDGLIFKNRNRNTHSEKVALS